MSYGRLQSFGCHGKELGQYDKNTIVNVWTPSIHVTKAQKKHANNQDIFLRTHEKKPHREELDERQKKWFVRTVMTTRKQTQ